MSTGTDGIRTKLDSWATTFKCTDEAVFGTGSQEVLSSLD